MCFDSDFNNSAFTSLMSDWPGYAHAVTNLVQKGVDLHVRSKINRYIFDLLFPIKSEGSYQGKTKRIA